MDGLVDRQGRVARDLRVSLTDRCNLRCAYCMPAEGLPWLPNDEVLSDAEVNRLIRIGVESLGITKLRFTGGEPLLRPGLEGIVQAAKQLRTPTGEVPETALTTNGLGLDKRLAGLVAAGLDRVNVSLDSLDRQRYATLTRRDRLPDVLRSLEAADAAGLHPVKVNAVVMRDSNEDDIVPLALHCLSRGYELRFIEQMPLGPQGEWDRDAMVTQTEILDRLRTRLELTPIGDGRGSAPAELWQVAADRTQPGGRIGVIASVTSPFCAACDRTRLTSDGQIRSCLFSRRETDLRGLLRGGASDSGIAEAWQATQWAKPPAHGIDEDEFVQPARTMSAIGG